MFSIYRILNKVNGKVYIGKTSNLASRLRQHRFDSKTSQKHLHKAWRKYGEAAFVVDVIDEASTSDGASALERFYISLFGAWNRERGYNLTLGGEGCPATDDLKAKLRAIALRDGNGFTAEQHRRASETLRKVLTGKPRPEWVRKKISLGNMGKKKSESHCKNMGLAQTRQDIQDEVISDLYRIGQSCAKIAEQFNTTRSTISWRLRRAGVAMRPCRPAGVCHS